MEALIGLAGVVIGGLLNGGVSWFFERRKRADERRAVARLLLVEVGDAGSTAAAVLRFGRWGEPAEDPKQVEWALWQTHRKELATLIDRNETWGNLANLAISVEWLNRRMRERCGHALADDDAARLEEARQEAQAVLEGLEHVVRGDRAPVQLPGIVGEVDRR
jgi:hypothetical protein